MANKNMTETAVVTSLLANQLFASVSFVFVESVLSSNMAGDAVPKMSNY